MDYTKKAIKHYSVANKFIETLEAHPEYGNVPEGSPDIFSLLSEAEEIVKKHKDVFGDTEDFGEAFDSTGKYDNTGIGFLEQDPYQNHKWRLTTQQIILSSALTEFMKNKNMEAFEKKGITNINSQEVSSLLEEIDKIIEQEYNKFLDQTKDCSFISREDKEALAFPAKYKMIPLMENVRALVIRYLVQFSGGNFKQGVLDTARIIEEGFKKYLKIYEVDMPLYDKLYEEFDNLRETGRNPLEVYLGRDGIYAYVGRRSQDVSRRRKLGLKERKKIRGAGEVVEIDPKYLVYPRYFRDYLSYDVKRQLLEQERITKESDPYFYDTGYTGTIPEQIMRIMDFDKEEIEKRIRLLSAPTVHRRVKGISENARSEIIEYIECNAKTEESAEGLIIDEETGKIRHIARPTTPEEQFYFMIVKQALTRHYWLRERLHHEPSGNINLDSEHYTLRIRKEYVEFLPDDFIHNPKDFFIQRGELLKGSKGEGEYPDEEIILFKLTDGTEIIAKRIELRKAKEARKEFAILIAAKKAGLPTAEPVGFLSGKEDADGSYLLMKKIEGRSGRKFEKELRESGKYSDEQIKNIMKQVTEKNKEMAELFRTTLKIDKRWRIKDTIIEFNEETGEVESVIPIDFERAINYDQANPKEIDEMSYSD